MFHRCIVKGDISCVKGNRYLAENLGGERIPLAPNPLSITAFSGYRRAVFAVFPPPLLLITIVLVLIIIKAFDHRPSCFDYFKFFFLCPHIYCCIIVLDAAKDWQVGFRIGYSFPIGKRMGMAVGAVLGVQDNYGGLTDNFTAFTFGTDTVGGMQSFVNNLGGEFGFGVRILDSLSLGTSVMVWNAANGNDPGVSGFSWL